MRIGFAYVAIAAPLTWAQAGEISSVHRGTWTESGDCKQARRIVISERTIMLVEPGRQRRLTDGDEAVFKGETLINASLPAKKEEDLVLAFSARLVEQDGEMILITEGLEDGGGFSGAFRRCKTETPSRTAAKEKTKPAAPRLEPTDAYRAKALLGGLY